MNSKLLLSGLICAALISGCSSSSPSSQPSGQWQNVHQGDALVTDSGSAHAESKR
ncbi:hypothetical protein [Candidatus Hamiltonella endosymbiont of Tuberolachnus salignus]|uniref:hypothetical protein n=1 Tax=Candidatus Williamhamiltonella endosymbiont of Tuberolachnus salignus TaxID=3077954 RepID=UPI0015C547C6|nr:hypothetical protein [Candidatus Hamiltonella defensa]